MKYLISIIALVFFSFTAFSQNADSIETNFSIDTLTQDVPKTIVDADSIKTPTDSLQTVTYATLPAKDSIIVATTDTLPLQNADSTLAITPAVSDTLSTIIEPEKVSIVTNYVVRNINVENIKLDGTASEDATFTNAHVQHVTITNANLKFVTITNSYITTLTISNCKIGDIFIDSSVITELIIENSEVAEFSSEASIIKSQSIYKN